MVDSFIEALIDKFDALNCCPVMTCFIGYVEIYDLMFPHSGRLGWNEDEIRNVLVQIPAFKQQITKLFARYHPSEFRTCKWHSLDHISDDWMDIVNMHDIHGGLLDLVHIRVTLSRNFQ